MKRFFYIAKIGRQGLVNYTRNKLALIFPKIFNTYPMAVDIFPTNRCNLKCLHCSCWNYDNQDKELALEKWKEIITQLKRWLGPYFSLRICGGEPLVRKDTVDIISFAHQQGIFTFLSTNGTLIDNNLAERIAQSGLDWISISLDSLNEKTYDFLRGQPGTFSATMRAIDLLKGSIKTIQIHTTIMQQNIDVIMNIVNFCQERGLLLSFQGLFGLRNMKTGLYYRPSEKLWPQDKEKVAKTLDRIISAKQRYSCIKDSIRYLETLKAYYIDTQRFDHDTDHRCVAYDKVLRIRYDGKMTLCRHSGPIGDIASGIPQEIWRSNQASLVREKLKNCQRNCSYIRCYYKESFSEIALKFKKVFLAKNTAKTKGAQNFY